MVLTVMNSNNLLVTCQKTHNYKFICFMKEEPVTQNHKNLILVNIHVRKKSTKSEAEIYCHMQRYLLLAMRLCKHDYEVMLPSYEEEIES